ncbi:mechanosensitive ion channel family protein [Parahaliea mediterranea]|uniref:Mechanosensitive ion channel n=1 Tax=Parahaliea mediterranea TaxID=651086 RepID=A0A939DIH7_9GAMM|nr:mechanosensitive ion channel domain-containing protein [Parahaliea mediterranea]MBN7798087.1 mechanosensitive ion channel [Parahaliea mediterranea]
MEELRHILHTPIIVLGDISIDLARILTVLAFVLAGSGFVLWSARFIRKQMGGRGIDPNAIQLVSRAYLILGLVLLGLVTLDMLSVPLTAFAFISGAVAIGVGFGAQNIINNFISGWILMWERPIKIGDFLELGEVRGSVEAINTRSTRIRRVDGVHLLIPNSQLLENTVTNWTLVDSLVRTTVRVGVAYGSDVRLTERLIAQAAAEHPDVLKTPESMVIFDDFGDSALIFELNIWIYATADRGLRMIRSDLRFSIDALFREHGVVIAFPQRDLHIDGELRLLRD